MRPLRTASSQGAVRTLVARVARRWLAANGLAAVRLDQGLPDDLSGYVQGLVRRGLAFDRVLVLDGDPEPVRVLFGLFEAEQVTCLAGPGWPDLESQVGPSERLLLEVDARDLGGNGFEALRPYLQRAPAAIARAKVADFEGDACDLRGLVAGMNAAGFEFHDVLHRPSAGLIRPATENLYLAFERGDSGEPGREGRARRKAESLSYLCAPIAGPREAVRLGGRGFRGLQGGVCNPGAVVWEGAVTLLARGERLPWAVQRRAWSAFAASSQPMALSLGGEPWIASAAEVRWRAGAAEPPARSEDFRLFEHEGRLYSNHSTLTRPETVRVDQPVDPERVRVGVGVSAYDPAGGHLTYLGAPSVNRPAQPMEKNWAMFSAAGAVRLIYSFHPYRLFTAQRFADLRFAATVERELPLPVPAEGLAYRNSINPVPYDERHFLHVVHQVFPTKQYVFWGVLIDRVSLVPVKMTARPLLRGGAGAGASIVYASAAIVREEQITVFGGINDSSIGVWRIPRAELDRHWLSLA